MKVIKNRNRNIIVEVDKIGCSHYIMKYFGNYGFQEYLSTGAATLDQYLEFIEKRLIERTAKSDENLRNSFSCAAFLARNVENDIILGRNMDCECGIGMLVRTQQSDECQSISLTNMCELEWDESTYDTLEQEARYTLAAPYSPCDGINEYGLVVAILSNHQAVYPMNRSITLLDMSIPRLLLNQAKNVNEAIALVQNYNLFYLVAPLHYIVADASGDCAIIEFINGEMVTTRIQKEYQVVTNFTIYNNPDYQGFGADRFQHISERLQETKGVISQEEALNLLKQNIIPGEGQWSAIYNLTRRYVQIMFRGEYDKVYEYHI